LSLLVIIGYTCYPLHIDSVLYSERTLLDMLLVKWGISGMYDMIQNVLLFVPLGLSVAFLMQHRNINRTKRLLIVLLMSFFVSYGIEMLQNSMVHRFSSLFDVLSNCLGAVLGFYAFDLARNESVIAVLSFLRRSTMNKVAGFVFLAVITCLTVLLLQESTSLRNWDASYPLLVGNERTGDRPWQGHIDALYIFDQAFDKETVERAYSYGSAGALFPESLLTHYDFAGGKTFEDKTGNLPALNWYGEAKYADLDEIPCTDADAWLQTESGVTYLNDRLKRTSSFSIFLTAMSYDSSQVGPARIISVSDGPSRRNFTIGQQGQDLIFRLRTPLTGNDGTGPAMIVSNVFKDMTTHDIITTFDGSKVAVYVDDVENVHTLELSPWTSFPVQRFISHVGVNWLIYKSMFYGIVFLPLGIVLALKFKLSRIDSVYIRVLVVGSMVVLPSLILELFLGYGTGPLRIQNFIIGSIFLLLPILRLQFCDLTYQPERSVIREH
jgi:glycopeptide antibiotics resistance protein